MIWWLRSDGASCFNQEMNDQEDRWAHEKTDVKSQRGPTRAGGSMKDLQEMMEIASDRVDLWLIRRWCANTEPPYACELVRAGPPSPPLPPSSTRACRRRKVMELNLLYLDPAIINYKLARILYKSHRRVFDVNTQVLKAIIHELTLTARQRYAQIYY